jgi:catechol 2,3-dioxygenase-like lactoylglutathione lyase family enzyme
MAVLGIAHVQLAIPPEGEDAARDFYGKLLGLRELPKPAVLQDRSGAWFQCGMQEIHCGVEEPIARSRRHPAFLVDNLNELKGVLETGGFPVEADRQLPGYRRFYATDPFGNRLEFLERE